MNLISIGSIINQEGTMAIQVLPEYREALTEIDGFRHLQILWWFDGCDNAQSRSTLIENEPYKKGPMRIGIFATRAPGRPNPIALTTVYVTHVDHEKGIIFVAYLDAFDNSPVLDIKPYTPSLDRVENPSVPAWCSHWPHCCEDSGDFDWSEEFNF